MINGANPPKAANQDIFFLLSPCHQSSTHRKAVSITDLLSCFCQLMQSYRPHLQHWTRTTNCNHPRLAQDRSLTGEWKCSGFVCCDTCLQIWLPLISLLLYTSNLLGRACSSKNNCIVLQCDMKCMISRTLNECFVFYVKYIIKYCESR